MAYDEMGNFGGDYGNDYSNGMGPISPFDAAEEERKRLEEERRKKQLENTVTKKHEVTQYADGSLTKKTTEEIPGMPDQNEMGDIMGSINQVIGQQPEDMLLGAVADKIVPGSSPYVKAATGPDVPGLIDMATTQQPEEALVGNVAGKLTGNNDQSWQDIMKNTVQDYANQERKGLGMQPVNAPVAPTVEGQPQQRQPGFAERIMNAIIPSAAAATLPQTGVPTQAPVAEAIPVEAPAQTQFKNLANSAGPNVAYQPQPVPQAGAGRGFVNPPLVNAPVAPGQAPVTNRMPGETDYDYQIRTQESGARPDIGYHYAPNAEGQRRSSAYGAYGITAPTYAGIQKADPYFQGRDITSLSPEEQARANQVLTRQNASQLTNYGIDATPGNLAAAHFLGAKGLKDYMESGYISPAAAAANGGEDKVRQIVERRMGGQYAPASGAVEAPVPTPPETITPQQQAIQRYQDAQNDPIALLQLRSDDTQPEWVRKRAGERASDLMIQERYQAQGTAKAQEMITNGDQTGIGRTLAATPKTQEGSAIKAALLNFIGLNKAADEEINRWGGYGQVTKTAMNAQGDTGLIEYNSQGKPLSGVKSDGTPMSDTELVAYSSVGGKTSDISGTQKQAVVNGELHTFSTKKTPQGTMYRDDTAGTGWTAQAPAGMTHLGQQEPGHLKGLTAANAVVTKMTKANQDSIAAVGRPQFTQDQINEARNQAYSSVSGKQFPGAGAVTAPIAPQGAPQGTAPIAPAGTTAQPAPAVQAPAVQAPAATTTTPPKGPKSIAQQILDYEAPSPSGPTTATKVAIMNEVNRLAAEQGKTYDAAQFKIASKTRQDFTTGVQGKAVQSMNVAIDHLDTLQDAATALNNGKMPIFNDIAQKFAKNTGQPAPTNFDALKSIVGSEVAKAVTGGASALGDREEIRAEINKANSPAQLAGVINKYQHLMAGQVKGLKQTYESAGLKDFDAKLLPRTKYVLNKTQEPTRSSW